MSMDVPVRTLDGDEDGELTLPDVFEHRLPDQIRSDIVLEDIGKCEFPVLVSVE